MKTIRLYDQSEGSTLLNNYGVLDFDARLIFEDEFGMALVWLCDHDAIVGAELKKLPRERYVFTDYGSYFDLRGRDTEHIATLLEVAFS